MSILCEPRETLCGELHPTQDSVCCERHPHEGKPHVWVPSWSVIRTREGTFTPCAFAHPLPWEREK